MVLLRYKKSKYWLPNTDNQSFQICNKILITESWPKKYWNIEYRTKFLVPLPPLIYTYIVNGADLSQSVLYIYPYIVVYCLIRRNDDVLLRSSLFLLCCHCRLIFIDSENFLVEFKNVGCRKLVENRLEWRAGYLRFKDSKLWLDSGKQTPF